VRADVAHRAGVSTQYLSEIERGRKEPSSEVLEAVGAALSLTLLDLTSRVSGALARGAGDGTRLMAA
jgi:transcriptional regulator with XRE-family HTH domain